jgi:adenosylhomocysteine nucleosidase
MHLTFPTSVPRLLRNLFAACLLGISAARALAAPWLDDTPRVAVMSAFEPEWKLLRARLDQPRSHTVNGVEFVTGRLRGHDVVLLLSGISMTNAAMNTQRVLDRFRVTHLLFSGIAGGVNPGLAMGDVTVPARWGQYLEVLFARETAPGRYTAPPWMDDVKLPAFGALHPRPVEARRDGAGIERRFWFEADPALLAVAARLGTVDLKACDANRRCLSRPPRLVVGGNGVSGSAFVDNAAFRDYTFRTFEANVLDMETAATAMVAWSNGVPFIAFRSLSDLAGGGEGANEMETFMAIAADNAARVLMAFLEAWRR